MQIIKRRVCDNKLVRRERYFYCECGEKIDIWDKIDSDRDWKWCFDCGRRYKKLSKNRYELVGYLCRQCWGTFPKVYLPHGCQDHDYHCLECFKKQIEYQKKELKKKKALLKKLKKGIIYDPDGLSG